MKFGLNTVLNAALACVSLVAVRTPAQTLQITPRFIDPFTASADSLDVPYLTMRIVVGTIDGSKVPFRFAGIQHLDCRGCGDVRPPDFVVVSPSNGVTPAVVWVALNPNVVPYLPSGTITFSVAFAKPGESCPCIGAPMVLVLRGQLPSVKSVLNAATLQPGAIAPGEIVSIFGENLGTPPVSSQFDSSGFYPTTLGNSTVTFNGTAAALLYVSTTQINAMVPYGIGGQTNVDIVVSHNRSANFPAFSVPVADTSPGIFTATGTGAGQGAILNYQRGLNSTANPAPKGSAVTLFATGAGLWRDGAGIWGGAVPDGSVFVTGTGPPAAPVSLTIGGQPARILYSGGAPFQPFGVIQVNAVVPAGIASGSQPVVLTIGQNSNAQQQVTVAVE